MKNLLFTLFLFMSLLSYSQNIDDAFGQRSSGGTTSRLNAISSSAKLGLITYNTDLDAIVWWDGSNFQILGSSTFSGDSAEIADGSVSNEEFQRINTLTSNAQTQLDNRVTLDGTQTITGAKTFENAQYYAGTLILQERTADTRSTAIGWEDATTDYFNINHSNSLAILWSNNDKLNFKNKGQNGSGMSIIQNNTDIREYTFPDASGTIALTSDITGVTDDQDLSEVLTEGNSTGASDIDMNGNDILSANNISSSSANISTILSDDIDNSGTLTVDGESFLNTVRYLKTDIEPVGTEARSYWDDSENGLKAYDGSAWRRFAFADELGTDDQNADEVPFTPTANVPEDNVQDAIEALGDNQLLGETVITASKTLEITDADGYLSVDSASNVTLTIPPNATVPFPIGTVINADQDDDGDIIIALGSGVTLFLGGTSLTDFKTLNRGHSVSLLKIGTDVWKVKGKYENALVTNAEYTTLSASMKAIESINYNFSD